MGTCMSSSSKPSTKKIVIAGAPASGKGTQCETIVEKVRYVRLPTLSRPPTTGRTEEVARRTAHVGLGSRDARGRGKRADRKGTPIASSNGNGVDVL